MSKYGIDVSHYQGTIDWAKVKASGKEFVILKVSQGSTLKDSKFDEYYAGAKKAGIDVGVYIYNKVNTASKAKSEAEFAVKCLAGKQLELGVWLDLEDSTMRGLGKTMLNTIIKTESDILEAAGYKVNIYCNRDWYVNILDVANLSKYKFWIARYPSGDNGTLKEGLKTAYMDLWQYSSKGSVNGIKGNVDLDIMYNVDAFYSAPVSAKPVNPYTEPVTNIKKGCKGEGVKWVQWYLKQMGYNLKIDGDAGAITEKYIIAAQKKFGLVADGIVGKATRAAFKKGV